MAKQGKILPARRPRSEESLLIRSAESLGRVIGTLQRQLEKSSVVSNDDGNGAVRRATKRAKSATAKKSAATGRAPARKKAAARKNTGKRR